VLGRQRYVCGDVLTEADIFMFTTLVRFDAVYHGHFKCNLRRIVDYPNLDGYLRDLYQLPGIAATVNLDPFSSQTISFNTRYGYTRLVDRKMKSAFAKRASSRQ